MESEQQQNNLQTQPQTEQPVTQPPIEKKLSKKKRNFGLLSQELLRLVGRGQASICEILRLKDYIPEAYSNPAEEKMYNDIIFDFSFFKTGNQDKFDDKLRSSQELLDKDEDFRLNNIEIIDRFFALFQAIYQYIIDWKTFNEQVNSGRFVQYTIDIILQNKEIKAVFCESIFIAGVMLLLVDRLIPGPIREKLIVSYYRYRGQSTIQNFEQIFELFKSTGYLPPKSFSNPKDETRPNKYPVEYFSRCEMPLEIVRKVIATLKDSDIYEQTLAFPDPEHRSHALSQQGSMLVTVLFFVPEILEKDHIKMREISDKNFNENWVISIYMGYTIDISEYWKEFKAANEALKLTLSSDSLVDLRKKYDLLLIEMDKNIKAFLNEGVMTEEYVLSGIEQLLVIMRKSNVVIKWFLLQRNITSKKYRDIFNANLNSGNIISLLLSLSQFEYLLKNMFQNLVGNKEILWNNDKTTCLQKLNELIQYYNGNSAFSQNKLENYSKYFEDTSKRIQDLNYNNPTSVGRKIGKIKDEIEEIVKLCNISGVAAARQNIHDINECLDHMLRIVNVKRNYLVYISKISDFSYAWICIQDYIQEMQNLLKINSKNVLLLRSTFLKLASILNFPLVRLFEIESEDIESVTNYYSGELVKFVKAILQIIPISIFSILDNVSNIFTSGFSEIPVKLQKTQIKDYAQTEKRYSLAKNVHRISLFTKGIYMMEKTLMGVIEVDPKTILEEGIRKELLKLLANTFEKMIDFGPNDKIDLSNKLDNLITIIKSIKRSFIYIQDYININGSKMWCEEMHRLINYYVELEANKFLTRKIKINSEKYELLKYNIPNFAPSKGSYTFLGRLVRFVIELIKPTHSTYYPANYTWYDNKNNELFGIKTINKIKQAIGVEGFQGFGKLLGYMNYQNILNITPFYNKLMTDNQSNRNLANMSKLFGSPFVVHLKQNNQFQQLNDSIEKFSKTTTGNFANEVNKIGQIEFLRKLQNYSLTENTQVDAYILSSQIKSMNEINLLILKNNINLKFADENNNDQQQNEQQNQENADNNNNNNENKNNNLNQNNDKVKEFYVTLCSFFEDFGYIDTLHTFYNNLTSLQYLPVLLAITTYNEITNYYSVDKKTLTIKKNKIDNFDLFYFTYGVYCILYQMGKNNIILFIALISSIFRNKLMNQYQIKDYKSLFESNFEIPKNEMIIQKFLQELASNAELDLNYFEINFNSYLMFRNIAK